MSKQSKKFKEIFPKARNSKGGCVAPNVPINFNKRSCVSLSPQDYRPDEIFCNYMTEIEK